MVYGMIDIAWHWVGFWDGMEGAYGRIAIYSIYFRGVRWGSVISSVSS